MNHVVLDTSSSRFKRLPFIQVYTELHRRKRLARKILKDSSADHVVYALHRRDNGESSYHFVPFMQYSHKRYAACFKKSHIKPLAVHRGARK